jgi:hypothetical protein
MADDLPLATLCEFCQQIFEGEWVEKEAVDFTVTSSNSTRQIEELGECSGPNREESIGSQMDKDPFSGDGWYERPDWVKMVAADIDTCVEASLEKTCLSPQHHTIAGLEQSARNGCHLCTILVDIVRREIQQLEESTDEVLSRLVGIIIVRPSNEDSDGQESITLEISYFIDGRVEEEAYVFSVDTLLIPHQSKCLLVSIPFSC